ncbi:histone-lysine N-methyltransferase SETMAR [Trichonephila clavipes]|nr:histone-lysine N-methyltransferase SETMAR [Trichonephila clavipes]
MRSWTWSSLLDMERSNTNPCASVAPGQEITASPPQIHDPVLLGRPSVISDALLQRTEGAIRALGHHIGGKSFHDDDEIKDEVEMRFRKQVATFYDCGIQKLVHRLNKCLDNWGDHVEK